MRRRRTWTLSVGAACLSSIAAATRPVERTIAHLDAADPAVRNAAAESLSLAGDAIRPAVIAALPGASPEAADRLATLLLRTVHWDAALRSGPDPDNGPSPRLRRAAAGRPGRPGRIAQGCHGDRRPDAGVDGRPRPRRPLGGGRRAPRRVRAGVRRHRGRPRARGGPHRRPVGRREGARAGRPPARPVDLPGPCRERRPARRRRLGRAADRPHARRCAAGAGAGDRVGAPVGVPRAGGQHLQVGGRPRDRPRRLRRRPPTCAAAGPPARRGPTTTCPSR